MFLSYTYYCQRALVAPFPKQHASSSHANQGPTCFSHHESPEVVPRSKGQALFIDSGLSSGRQAARAQSLFPSFPLKNQDKAASSAAYKYQRTSFMEKEGSGRTRPRKSRISPLSPLVKQELENKKNSLFLLFFSLPLVSSLY
ncbi:hypothetical protein AXF42_Ash002194 [Apostasia shenzhenica]|uniref:Uncharacterized protein n=1 Tax=Apostasia shenzhenica TaxID=1088818 RepID=A0A2I0AMW6_9ASPA|nr:hypothetical protein AXF42_Ash002194 [Apostasia shenzhenica]